MADLTRLDDDEQRELCELLESEPVTVPTIDWTVSFMASKRPPEHIATMYPPWWQGQEWWDQLPRRKQLEYAAKGFNK